MKINASILFTLSVFLLTSPCRAEGALHWTDARDLLVEGKGWTNTVSFYDRLPARAEGKAPKAVWGLSHDSAV